MLRKLMIWVTAAVIFVQSFAFCNTAQAANFPTFPAAVTQVSTSRQEKGLTFSDTDTFYEELSDALKAGKPIDIKTPFRSYQEFPPRLKDLFSLQGSQHPPASAGIAAGAQSNASIQNYKSASINYEALRSAAASTAIGMGIGGTAGSFFGGGGAVPGALIGAGVGLSTWAVSQAVVNNCHKVIIQTSDKGIIITLEPVCRQWQYNLVKALH